MIMKEKKLSETNIQEEIDSQKFKMKGNYSMWDDTKRQYLGTDLLPNCIFNKYKSKHLTN